MPAIAGTSSPRRGSPEPPCPLRGVPADVTFLLDGRTLEGGDHFTFMTDAGPVDCLVTPAGTDGFVDLDASATDEDLDGLVVRVASLDDLIRMKRAADRPQDRIAIEWLSALRDELEEELSESRSSRPRR